MSASASATASPSPQTARQIRRVAILFAGGPAPAANAVISTAAASFLRHGIEVLGILHGYAHLVELRRRPPDAGGRDYIVLDQTNLQADAEHPRHLDRDLADQPRQGRVAAQPTWPIPSAPPSSARSIGHSPRWASTPWSRSAATTRSRPPTSSSGSRTTCPPDEPRIAVVHVPKTIDNDYRGIDFTFGYFTAVETLASEIRNLLADAEAGRMYFLVETMGRSAGWLAYGAAIAGEASLVLSVEDLDDDLMTEETSPTPRPGMTTHPQDHGHRQDRRSDRPRHARPREGGQGVRRDRAGRGPGPVPAVAATSRASSSTTTATSRCRRPTWPRT